MARVCDLSTLETERGGLVWTQGQLGYVVRSYLKNHTKEIRTMKARIVCWLILSTWRALDSPRRQASGQMEEGLSISKLLDGDSHISCGQHHTMGYEKKPVLIVLCGLNEDAVTSREVLQSYQACHLTVKSIAVFLNSIAIYKKVQSKILLQ